MERYDITIQMYSADASGTQYVWGKVPAEEGDFVLYADAQATIAALEQRVKELKQWVQDQSTANLETMRHMDEMQSRAMDAESQLAQRTAELARVRGELQKAERCISEWVDRHSTYFSKLEIDFAKPERRLTLCRGQEARVRVPGGMAQRCTRADCWASRRSGV